MTLAKNLEKRKWEEWIWVREECFRVKAEWLAVREECTQVKAEWVIILAPSNRFGQPAAKQPTDSTGFSKKESIKYEKA